MLLGEKKNQSSEGHIPNNNSFYLSVFLSSSFGLSSSGVIYFIWKCKYHLPLTRVVCCVCMCIIPVHRSSMRRSTDVEHFIAHCKSQMCKSVKACLPQGFSQLHCLQNRDYVLKQYHNNTFQIPNSSFYCNVSLESL